MVLFKIHQRFKGPFLNVLRISVEVCFLKFDVYIMKWIESMFFGKFDEKQYYKIVSFKGRLKGVSQAEL